MVRAAAKDGSVAAVKIESEVRVKIENEAAAKIRNAAGARKEAAVEGGVAAADANAAAPAEGTKGGPEAEAHLEVVKLFKETRRRQAMRRDHRIIPDPPLVQANRISPNGI